jgi:capsule polysaccharide export protein KpsE/RkpR
LVRQHGHILLFISFFMAFPVHLLTTIADCDAVLTEAQAELRTFQVRESVLDLKDDTTTASATATAAELTDLDATIAQLTSIIPTLSAGSKIRRTNERALRTATRRREDLTLNQPTQNAVTALLKALDARQVTVQVAEIQQFIAEVTAHRATL